MRRVALGFAVLAPVVAKLLIAPSYIGADDAYIHLTVVENLAEHGTWGLRPHEPLQVSTSPAFVAAMALLSFLPVPLTVLGSLGSLVAAGLTVALAARFADREAGSGAGLLAACLVASNLHLWRWAGTFMETTWAAAAVLAALGITMDRRAPGGPGRSARLGAAWALCTLLRPESALVGVGALLAARGADARQALAVWVGLVAGPAGLAWWAFGSPLPTSLAAKSSGLSPSASVALAWTLVAGTGAGAALLLVARCWVASRGRVPALAARGSGSTNFGLLLLTPVLVGAYFVLRHDHPQSAARYALPYLPPLAVGAAILWARAGGELASARLAVAGQAAFAVVATTLWVLPSLRSFEGGYRAAQVELAQELGRRCARGESALVVSDIGIFGRAFAGPCRLLDAGGIANPELAGMNRAALLREYSIDWVVKSITCGGPWEAPSGVAAPAWQRSFPSPGVRQAGLRCTASLHPVGSP